MNDNTVLMLMICAAVVVMAWKMRQKRMNGGAGSRGAAASGSAGSKANKPKIPHESKKTIAEKTGKYGHLTADALRAVPDENLLEAVIYNLQSKMKDDMSDALQVLSELSLERQAVYLAYTVTRMVNYHGFDDLAKKHNELLMICAAGLKQIGFKRAPGMMVAAARAKRPDSMRISYLRAFNKEKGQKKIAQYIRSNIDAFCDEVQGN